MPSFGPDAASCQVFTFKQGVLSAVAHDLLLQVTRFEIVVDPAGAAVSARLDAGSLRVVAAMGRGRPLPEALRPADKVEIEATIRKQVLRSERYPEIRFESNTVSAKGDGYEVRGLLTLTGATREVVLPVRKDSGRLVTEIRLHQQDFGIRPYSALLGTLRVQPDVLVTASMPDSVKHPGRAHAFDDRDE